MKLPRIASDPIASLLAPFVETYITRQRKRLLPSTTALGEASAERLLPYFPLDVLEQVRIVQCDPLPIEQPPFLGAAHYFGVSIPEVQLVSAITFDDVIASPAGMSPDLLFHELVHVVQFRLLGVAVFARLYVRGLLVFGNYDDVPLERCAAECEDRFSSEMAPFNVESYVASRIERGLL